jgi:hypothetical protein
MTLSEELLLKSSPPHREFLVIRLFFLRVLRLNNEFGRKYVGKLGAITVATTYIDD